MIKTIVLHHLLDTDDLPAAERWFYRHHIPEVLRTRPLSYVSYRAVPAPAGAEAYGCMNYKVHEKIGFEEAGSLGFLSMTPEVVPLRVIMVNVPLMPTQDFMGSASALGDSTILRWLTIFRYPVGVSPDEGDEWYVNVHAKEVTQQSGLTRFFSYRVLPGGAAVKEGVSTFLHPRSTVSSGWHRVSEQWYENGRRWRESVIDSPPRYTAPAWANYASYPFFQPWSDFAGIFILERPSNDWLRELPPAYV
jgi:hypothetical protein